MLASDAPIYEVEHAASVLLPERFIVFPAQMSKKKFVPFGTRLNELLQSVLHLRFRKTKHTSIEHKYAALMCIYACARE